MADTVNRLRRGCLLGFAVGAGLAASACVGIAGWLSLPAGGLVLLGVAVAVLLPVWGSVGSMSVERPAPGERRRARSAVAGAAVGVVWFCIELPSDAHPISAVLLLPIVGPLTLLAGLMWAPTRRATMYVSGYACGPALVACLLPITIAIILADFQREASDVRVLFAAPIPVQGGEPVIVIEGFVERDVDVARELSYAALARTARLLGVAEPRPKALRLRAFRSRQELRAAALRLQVERPETTDRLASGNYYRSIRTALVLYRPGDWKASVVHEAVHWAVGELAPACPLVVDEGIAMSVSHRMVATLAELGHIDSHFQSELRRLCGEAVDSGPLPSVRDALGWDSATMTQDFGRGYRLAQLLVEEMREAAWPSDDGGLPKFAVAVRFADSAWDALTRTFPVAELEERWHDRIRLEADGADRAQPQPSRRR